MARLLPRTDGADSTAAAVAHAVNWIAVSVMAEVTMCRLGVRGGPIRDEGLIERAFAKSMA